MNSYIKMCDLIEGDQYVEDHEVFTVIKIETKEATRSTGYTGWGSDRYQTDLVFEITVADSTGKESSRTEYKIGARNMHEIRYLGNIKRVSTSRDVLEMLAVEIDRQLSKGDE